MIARVRQTFGVPEISLRRLFEEPTIEQLGLIVTQTQVQSADTLEVERLIAQLQALSPGEAALLLERED